MSVTGSDGPERSWQILPASFLGTLLKPTDRKVFGQRIIIIADHGRGDDRADLRAELVEFGRFSRLGGVSDSKTGPLAAIDAVEL